MKLSRHFIVSISLGTIVWILTNSFFASLVCFFSGFFIDVDHIMEYIVHFGWKKFSLKKCYLAYEQPGKQDGFYQFKKSYVVFHSNEFAVVLWLLAIYTQNIIIFGSALGYSSHLLLDNIGNHMHPYSYFILWRVKNNFHIDKVLINRILAAEKSKS